VPVFANRILIAILSVIKFFIVLQKKRKIYF